jgi:hypothetical protein
LGCSPIKRVRELGSERRETVRPLSGIPVEPCEELLLVREDRSGPASGVPAVVATATLGSYAGLG